MDIVNEALSAEANASVRPEDFQSDGRRREERTRPQSARQPSDNAYL